MKQNYQNISNIELSGIIDNWIKNERDRAIMKRRLIDGICFEPLAEEFGLSARHVKTIVYKNEIIIFKHLHDKTDSEIQQEIFRILCCKIDKVS